MLYLNDSTVAKLLWGRWSDVIDRIESAFLSESAHMIPKTYLNVAKGDFRAMPAALDEYVGIKWVGVFPENKEISYPTITGSFFLNERDTGRPVVGMDCSELTAVRTAAVSAIAAKYCAPSDTKKIALIGCGAQAFHHFFAYTKVFPNLETIALFDKDMKACIDLSKILEKDDRFNFEFSEDIEPIIRNADIITTLTPSRTPYLDVHHIKSDCHINAVGADAEGKRELMPNVIDGAADIVCDDPKQAFHSGELQYNEWPHLTVSTLAQVIKSHEEMQLRKGISVFDSTGVALEDIAVGIFAYNQHLVWRNVKLATLERETVEEENES